MTVYVYTIRKNHNLHIEIATSRKAAEKRAQELMKEKGFTKRENNGTESFVYENKVYVDKVKIYG